jgi:hypothetical protein
MVLNYFGMLRPIVILSFKYENIYDMLLMFFWDIFYKTIIIKGLVDMARSGF